MGCRTGVRAVRHRRVLRGLVMYGAPHDVQHPGATEPDVLKSATHGGRPSIHRRRKSKHSFRTTCLRRSSVDCARRHGPAKLPLSPCFVVLHIASRPFRGPERLERRWRNHLAQRREGMRSIGSSRHPVIALLPVLLRARWRRIADIHERRQANLRIVGTQIRTEELWRAQGIAIEERLAGRR